MPTDQSKPQRRSRLAQRSPLLNPLPAIAAAITVFLVTAALLGARLLGTNPATVQTQSSAKVVHAAPGGGTRKVLRTTPSGRRIVETVQVGANGAERRSLQRSPLTTRTSGHEGEAYDD